MIAAEPRRCPHCGKQFVPSPFRPAQQTCSSPECQNRRRVGYHRAKYRSDPEYRLVCRESDQKWRARNEDYQRSYRLRHPDYADRNRRAQHRRDRKRRMKHLVKNNLAISEVLIFQTVVTPEVRSG